MNKTLVKPNTLWALTLRRFANNKGTDQPAHPRRLISAFVIRFFGKFVILTCYKRNFNFLASFCSWGDWFDSRFVGNTFSPVFGGLRTTSAQFFFFCFLECIIFKLTSSEISTFKLVYVAEHAGFNSTWSEILKTDFLATRPNYLGLAFKGLLSKLTRLHGWTPRGKEKTTKVRLRIQICNK